MNRPPAQWMLNYLGWSGFDLRFPGAMPILIDPAGEGAIPTDRDICLAITHGHLEHIAGTAAYLKNKRRKGAAAVFASPVVCRQLKRLGGNERDRFHHCRPGGTHNIGDIAIDVFLCRHMPLLPPEKGEKLRRLRQLASNPGLAAGIVARALRFPFPGPTLGFRLTGAGAPGILFFGEGLHRCVRRDEIARIGARLPGDILIAAVEPEDVEVMPELVSATGAPVMVPYEAHGPWRKEFGMPRADLDALSARLRLQGCAITRTNTGAPVALPCAGGAGR